MTEPDYVPDRRPISARQHPLSISIARWLATHGVSPNAISVGGMIAGIVGGGAFACSGCLPHASIFLLIAAAGMQLRLLANMFDGMVAIQTGRASPVGELYNEVPDRVSDAAIFIGAGYAFGGRPELGYLAAVVALFVAYVRAEGKVSGAPQDYCGPMAKPHRMAVLTAAAVFAAILPARWQENLVSVSTLGVVASALLVIVVGGAITAMRRLRRTARVLRTVPPRA
ncbi:MAG TPA: CDP-alcohol phosphatidyltransferase family protein [Pirellulales bacterium]|nr:CDP-alcohol phosphatidyltransferase family protein [Pirellulales bacterium]